MNQTSFKAVLIDTCVIVDAIVPHRPRHAAASALIAKLIEHEYRFPFPMHGMFEIGSAIKSERLAGSVELASAFKLPFMAITIDDAFCTRYYDLGLPHMPAGDLIFLSIAVKDRLHFITEDAALYKKAKSAGVQVFSVAEYLPRVI